MSSPVASGRWTIVPTLKIEETYSDNLRLRPPGSERSDWVTVVTPAISVNRTSARMRVSASYSPQVIYRAVEGSQEVVQQFSGTGNAELMQRLLYLDARASVRQQDISVLGPQAQSNVNNTGNRTSVQTFLISPYLRRNFGSTAQGEARLTYSTVDSDASTNSNSSRVDLRLSSGPAFKLYTWNLAYEREHIKRSQRNDVTDQVLTATGKRLITPQLALTSSAGYEEHDYNTSGTQPKGEFWNVGGEWTPTPRTRLAANTGRRYYGPAHSFDFSHRTRLTTWNAKYSEEITTTRSELLVPAVADTATYVDTLFLRSIPDPAARAVAVQNFIAQNALPSSLNVPVNFLTDRVFLVKRFMLAAGIHGVHNTVLGNLFTETRDAQEIGGVTGSTGDFATSSRVEQSGGSLAWNLRWSKITTSTLSMDYTRTGLPDVGRTDRRGVMRLTLTRQLQPQVSTSLSYRALRNDSNVAAGEYTEHAVTAVLAMQF